MAPKPKATLPVQLTAKQPYDKKIAKEKERAQKERLDKLNRLKSMRLGEGMTQKDQS